MAEPVGLTVHERPDLDEPVLLVMLSGWIDASGAAAAAMALVENAGVARTIATFDPDVFIDYRARRPVLELRDGVAGDLVWPTIELKVARDLDGRSVLLLTGYEPDAQWRRFVELVTGLCVEFGVGMMVGLGAYPFATPHTRPARLSCTTPSAELAARVPFLRNSVEVPAGVEAALERAFHVRGVPAIGLWVQVPHYIAAMAYPGASAALVRAAADITGRRFDTHGLDEPAAVVRRRLDDLVAANPEHVTLVQQLEAIYDSSEAWTPEGVGMGAPSAAPLDAGALPSGDELAAEVERFLREQGG